MDFHSTKRVAPAVVGQDADSVLISFHTVPAEELIEEKMGESDAGTTQKKYVEGN